MGIPIVTSARISKNKKAGKPYLNEPLFFENFRSAGLVRVSWLDSHLFLNWLMIQTDLYFESFRQVLSAITSLIRHLRLWH